MRKLKSLHVLSIFAKPTSNKCLCCTHYAFDFCVFSFLPFILNVFILD